jgi:Ca2+-binding RTX toxin-like protein
MAILTAYESVYMNSIPGFSTGQVIGAEAHVISISDGPRLEEYYGNFKYKNGYLESGTFTGYGFFERGDTFYIINQLKLNVKTVGNLIISGDNVGLQELVFKGKDTLNGSDFEDVLFGFNGNDLIYGNGGVDYIQGGKGNDVIHGGNGDDFLIGDIYDLTLSISGDDLIYGGDGNDVIGGKLGKNILTGGSGKDTFVFETKLSSSNKDTVTDFKAVEGDSLNLDSRIFTNLSPTGFGAENLVIGTKAIDNNDYLIFNPVTHTLSYDADGSGAGKALAFVVLTGVATIDVNDISVY